MLKKIEKSMKKQYEEDTCNSNQLEKVGKILKGWKNQVKQQSLGKVKQEVCLTDYIKGK